MKERLILDIRFFESDKPNRDGTSLPSGIGCLIPFPSSIHVIGDRIARKLRENGLYIGTFDHVYINLTTAIKEKQISFSPRTMDKEDSRFRYIDYGVDINHLKEMNEKEIENFVNTVSFDVLRFIVGSDTEKLFKIQHVKELVEKYGEDLKIHHKIKKTKNYSVKVLYKIAPYKKSSTGWIEYSDLKTGAVLQGCFVELEFYEDIYFLVSSIAIKDEKIIFKPRSSFKADLYNSRYDIPLSVGLDSLERA